MTAFQYTIFILALTSLQTCNSATTDDNLFTWAKQNGAKISTSIEIKSTPYGGRGLYATNPIPCNTELICIPSNLQLGSKQLARGSDDEMQLMARSLPWKYILENELTFVPLAVALLAEKRRGQESLFWPYLESLPCVGNAVSEEVGDKDLEELTIWDPIVAKRIKQIHLGMQTIYNTLAPRSISIEELRWAPSQVCSRSLIRKRIPELTREEVKKIGIFASSDHSRMLPIIDLVNHGSFESANVWVGHISRHDDDDDDFSTSLKTIRDVRAGEELLFDYGGEKKIGNARLLLDYGFVLPEHTEYVLISLEEFTAALSELLDGKRLNDVAAIEKERLCSLVSILIKQAEGIQSGGIIMFDGNGDPAVHTHAIAICMTCRNKDEVMSLLKVFDKIKQMNLDNTVFASQIANGVSEIQREFARYALKIAAGFALATRQSVSDGKCSEVGFVSVCREYSKSCRKLLQRVADMSR